MNLRLASIAFTVLFLLAMGQPAPAQKRDDTETVHTTFYVIPGKEAEFANVLKKAWPTYHKLGMVLATPHLILSGNDDQGRPYFIEILRWKDHDAPDHAPKEVTDIWDQITALCEKRDGHRRIEFYEVKIFDPRTK